MKKIIPIWNNKSSLILLVAFACANSMWSQKLDHNGIDFGLGYSKIIYPEQAIYLDMYSDSFGLDRSFSKYSGFRDAFVGFAKRKNHLHLSMSLQAGWHIDEQKYAKNNTLNKFTISQKNVFYNLGLGYYLNKVFGLIGEFSLYNAKYNWRVQTTPTYSTAWDGAFTNGPTENIRTMSIKLKMNMELPMKNRYGPDSYFVIAPYWLTSINNFKYYDLMPMRLRTYSSKKSTPFSGWGVNCSYRLPISGD